MARYAAFLRGVSPMNAKMPELKRAFEAAGFTEVRTVLSSGNVVFTARAASDAALERKAEAAMAKTLGRSFLTIVRSVDHLKGVLASNPYESAPEIGQLKRTITFLREAPAERMDLPVKFRDATVVSMHGKEIFSVHIPWSEHGADFMVLIEKTFGKNVTTRTWESVTKTMRAGETPQALRGGAKAQRR